MVPASKTAIVQTQPTERFGSDIRLEVKLEQESTGQEMIVLLTES